MKFQSNCNFYRLHLHVINPNSDRVSVDLKAEKTSLSIELAHLHVISYTNLVLIMHYAELI